jgi:hypothetical protein
MIQHSILSCSVVAFAGGVVEFLPEAAWQSTWSSSLFPLQSQEQGLFQIVFSTNLVAIDVLRHVAGALLCNLCALWYPLEMTGISTGKRGDFPRRFSCNFDRKPWID